MWRFIVFLAVLAMVGCGEFRPGERDEMVRRLEQNKDRIVVREIYDASHGCGEFMVTRERVTFYHNGKMPIRGDVYVVSVYKPIVHSVQLELRVEK